MKQLKKIISLMLVLSLLLLCSCDLNVAELIGNVMGADGADGKTGLSAYEVAVQEGFVGTEAEWITSLYGADGKPNTSAPEIKDGNWWIDGKDTGIKASGKETNVEITKEKPLAGKTIVCFGDSITGAGTGTGKDISSYLAEFTGATVYNVGFGGCRMTTYLPKSWDAFSMYRLAEAVNTGDFSYQAESFAKNQAEIAADSNATRFPAYFKDHYEKLTNIDFNEVDIITIAYGTNDLTGGRLRPNDDFTRSFHASTGYSIEKILEAYPHISIYLCTPIYRSWTLDNGEFIDSSEREYYGFKLTDYVQAIKEVGAEYNIPVIDLYYELGINRQNYKSYFPETDGTHPDENGRRLMAKKMADEMF